MSLVGRGADFEDEGARSLNHFFDPLRDEPLSVLVTKVVSHTSPDWALEVKGPIEGVLGIGKQELSFRDARSRFHEALVSKGKAQRDQAFGRLFETLGHVVHHIQDMAQPQHVRNDEHLFHSSRFEAYTSEVHRGRQGDILRAAFDFLSAPGGYPLVVVPRARDFWATATEPGPAQGTGRGIGVFTNNNFLSAGTNFLLVNDQPVADRRYPRPVPTGSVDGVPLRWLLKEAGVCRTLLDEGPAPANGQPPACELDAEVDFYWTEVHDRYSGVTDYNLRASSLSILDEDLKPVGASSTDPGSGQTVTVNRLFSMNRFNVDAAHQFLIPRAVAYSAGLIDYFFRGKLDFRADPAIPGHYAIRMGELSGSPASGRRGARAGGNGRRGAAPPGAPPLPGAPPRLRPPSGSSPAVPGAGCPRGRATRSRSPCRSRPPGSRTPPRWRCRGAGAR
jgi:hypothetical protein